MLCSSDMIFPRLNALSLWLLIDSLFLLFLGMFLDGGVNAGWTFYVPLCILNYSSIDMMFFSLHFAGLSSLFGSFNVTFFSQSLYQISFLRSLTFQFGHVMDITYDLLNEDLILILYYYL